MSPKDPSGTSTAPYPASTSNKSPTTNPPVGSSASAGKVINLNLPLAPPPLC